MRRVRQEGGEEGFALLAALLLTGIVVLATASLAVVTVSTTAISGDDAASARAADVAETGVADALERVRWGWAPFTAMPVSFTVGGVGCDARGSYAASVSLMPQSAAACPHARPGGPIDPADPTIRAVRVEATGRWGGARRVVHAFALVTPDALPRGLVVGGDATIESPTELQGCGLYAGGDVSGREHVALTSPPDAPPLAEPAADLACAGLYPTAGVHARGVIRVGAVEEHEGGGAPAADSDRHAGVVPPDALVAGPSPAMLAALASHASDPVAARTADGVDLALLDQSAPPVVGDAVLPAGGRIVVLSGNGASPAVLYGARPTVPGACPLTVVVVGDCTTSAGAAGAAPPQLGGALVVTGTLTVVAPLLVQGGLFAARLVVDAPLTVTFGSTIEQYAPPGAWAVHSYSWKQ